MAAQEQLALIRAYQRTDAGLRERALSIVLALWEGLTGWRDADAGAWLEQALPVLIGAQQALGELTTAYLTSLIGDMTGASTATAGAAGAGARSVVSGQGLRGTDPAEVYRRPFVTVRAALAGGHALPEAVRMGRNRLETTAATDMQLAATRTARQQLAADGRVVGYRRVPGGGRNCALCLLASTQSYRKDRLMPIHPNCSCKPVPIVGSQDPGQVLDEDLRDQIHDAVAQFTGRSDLGSQIPDYRKIIIEHDHGEIGAVMGLRGHEFTGPGDLPR